MGLVNWLVSRSIGRSDGWLVDILVRLDLIWFGIFVWLGWLFCFD